MTDPDYDPTDDEEVPAEVTEVEDTDPIELVEGGDVTDNPDDGDEEDPDLEGVEVSNEEPDAA